MYYGTATHDDDLLFLHKNDTRLYDNSSRQLEYGHPTGFGDLDDANENDFIGGNVAISQHPLEGLLDRNALALLKPV